ncbi:restriction endonuclease [Streptococcus uberis]|uniref:type I restriction endonuclease n=1 Tax=Streptococcus uberis TaxID=1349 RepID=UPI0012B51FFA|nr:type I restriction endonuclease [Streptococcus uberis]MTC89829.1 restriction endonuclease [Streptococcus uberis]MTC96759.1 restriction endonuclease [Streptococcus uberis]
MIHNEDSRVKVPALLHFKRIGYEYQTKKNQKVDSRNNIFIDIFAESINKINNQNYSEEKIHLLINEIADLTDNQKDKGMSFFERLTSPKGIMLIDLENPQNNDFRVVSELTYKRQNEEFRPDITILVNGIPLGFLEAKKPNNRNGIQAEFERMNYRSGKEEFAPYFNQLQVLGFSNNLPYDDTERVKLSGSFYTTPNGSKTSFNHFREEREIPVSEYIPEDFIDYVLADNSIIKIKSSNEFSTNLKPNTPCNEFITSVFSKERLIKFIRYGIVYVDSMRDGLHKHIIRYPQFFAIDALIEKIENGLSRGIVWHTQGSGKTALAYFMTNVLRDYYQKQGIITKFYFVVDRLDLLIQASSEFSARGMTIANIDSREDFTKNIKSSVIMPTINDSGNYKETMNVVNIQKFTEDSTVDTGLTKKIQRIYFLDEVHRSYKPKGTFLANLLGSDPDGIFIGLTGTPILKKEFKSTDLFDEYIHKYYYNKSIADGYTLKIKKENISTEFRSEVRGILDIKEGSEIPSRDWEIITKQPKFIDKFCRYIVEDFNVFRDVQNDGSLGYMVITSSSEQARSIQKWFRENSNLKTALVLYDEENNKEKQEEFRGKKSMDNPGVIESGLHGVVVYNMLLTGFDAPRLKRLYLLRRIKDHSLLQTLARVNRPYKDMKYGYVVDFVDITEEYEQTNQRYIEELKADIADEEDEADIEDMFVDVDAVKEQIKQLNNRLFRYMGNIVNDSEQFQIQIQPFNEAQLRELRSDLSLYKESYNELRMAHEDVSNIPINKIDRAFKEVSSRLSLKYAEERLGNEGSDIDEIDFTNLIIEFIRIGEIDLDFTTEDDVINKVNAITNALSANVDKEDEAYRDIEKRLKSTIQMLKKDDNRTEQVKGILKTFDEILIDIKMLNAANDSITSMYNGDDSVMRVHKRIEENYNLNLDNATIFNIMQSIISDVDGLLSGIHPTEQVMQRQMLNPVRKAFKKQGMTLSINQVRDIVSLFVEDKFK